MQETAISWTKYTNNPIRYRNTETVQLGWHCQKVSDGCRYCYSETLNLKWGTRTPYNAATFKDLTVFFDDNMAGKLYTIKDASAKVFMYDMTDIFGAFIPDYIRAAAWSVMLDLPQHVFQVLTKRPESAILWQERFDAVRQTDEYKALAAACKNKKVQAAMTKPYPTAWPNHIWMGTSVEDARVVKRIDTLRKVPAHIRFLSCEPLIGPLGSVDLTDIHWVIVGGESGLHMKTKEGNERWMDQAWARELRDSCVNQGTAFFYKQDSGHRTELRTWLVEEDGSRWKWEQWPHNLVPAVNVDTGEIWQPRTFRGYRDVALVDSDWGSSKPFAAYPTPEQKPTQPESLLAQPVEAGAAVPEIVPSVEIPTAQLSKPRTKVVKFQDVREHWDSQTRKWDSDEYVYIGRFNSTHNLPESPFHNPFKLAIDTPEERAAAIEKYRAYITDKIDRGFLTPNVLYGKTLVCWCSPQPCHGDVLVEILNPVLRVQKQAENKPQQPQQLTLF
jgi:protein gp37